MLMVIFGAGASFDSAATFPPRIPVGVDEESRPPLADDLFQQRSFFDRWVERYPECTPVVTRLRLHTRATLEDEMERYRLEAEHEPQRAVELNAVRYYLRWLLWGCSAEWLQHTKGVTNYVSLLGNIRVWKNTHPTEEVRFVTFNYDTLLEHACRQSLQIEMRSVSSYMSPRVGYKVFKPHGSTNWVRTLSDTMGVEAGNPEHSIIALGHRVELAPGFHLMADPGQLQLEGRYVFPALALPVNTKVNFACPDDHMAQLKADIPLVTKLLVIGWRATEPHFLEFWKEPRPGSVPGSISKILIVAGGVNQAQGVQQNLVAAGIQGKFDLSDGGFSQFVAGPELDRFLAD